MSCLSSENSSLSGPSSAWSLPLESLLGASSAFSASASASASFSSSAVAAGGAGAGSCLDFCFKSSAAFSEAATESEAADVGVRGEEEEGSATFSLFGVLLISTVMWMEFFAVLDVSVRFESFSFF